MASRAMPPHQDISAPLMAMTPLTICSCADAAVSSESAMAIDHVLLGMESLRLDSHRMQPCAMVFFQFAVGVDDLGQLLDHGGQMLSWQGIVKLVVGQFRVDAIADAAQA